MSKRRRAAQVRLGRQELEQGDELLGTIRAELRRRYLVRRAALAPKAPVAERSSMSEAEWQRRIVSIATMLQLYVYHPKLSRWSEHGWPDLSLLPTPESGRSRALYIEVKSDGNDLTEEQVRVIDLMIRAGIEVHVCRPCHGIEHVGQLLGYDG